MNIHYLQHVLYEGLGSIANWAEYHKHQVTATRFYDGAPLPAVDGIDWLIVIGGDTQALLESLRDYVYAIGQ